MFRHSIKFRTNIKVYPRHELLRCIVYVVYRKGCAGRESHAANSRKIRAPTTLLPGGIAAVVFVRHAHYSICGDKYCAGVVGRVALCCILHIYLAIRARA